MDSEFPDRDRSEPVSRSCEVRVWTGWRRATGLIGSGICMALAVLGVFLPLLPATPFVLLASYLLVRSSAPLHVRLRRSRLFGRLLRDWEERRGIRLRDKVRATGIVIVCAGVSLFAVVRESVLFAGILVLVTVGLVVIWRLPLVDDPEP